jgi:hypothetical protein
MNFEWRKLRAFLWRFALMGTTEGADPVFIQNPKFRIQHFLPSQGRARARASGAMLKGKQGDAISSRVNCQKGSTLEVFRGLKDGSTDMLSHGCGADIFGPYLNDTGFACGSKAEQGSEIEIVGENGVVVTASPSHDFRVRRVRSSNLTPVAGLDPGIGKGLNPSGAEVHADYKPHRSDGFQGNLTFFGPPRGIGKSGPDILNGEVGVEFEDFGNIGPRSEEAGDGSNSDAGAANAGPATHDGRVQGDPVDFREGDHDRKVDARFRMSS